MALTKVTGGILSQPIDLGITTATTGFFSGIVTAQSVRVLGDLTVDGSTTTLDTVVTEVDRLEIGANNTTVGVAITQSGTGNALTIDDGNTRVFTVQDGGSVRIGDNASYTAATGSEDLVVGALTGNNNGITIITGSGNQTGNLSFADSASGNAGAVSYRHTDNTMLFRVAGGTRMSIKGGSGGRVGIGTTNPTQSLHIYNSSPIIQFTDPDSGLGSRINADNGNLYFDTHNDNRDVVFRGGNSSTDEVARITGDGKVGIGTDNPQTTLEVVGSGVSVFTDSKNAAVELGSGRIELSRNDSVSYIDFKTGLVEDFDCRIQQFGNGLRFYTGGQGSTDERLRINSDGDVGIGTNNPTTLLTLAKDANPTLTFFDYTNNAKSQILGSAGGQLVFQTDINSVNANSDFIFRADGGDSANEIVRFKDSGEVGIGTITPAAVLHVEKNGTNQVLARFESNLGTNNNRAITLTSPETDSTSNYFTFATGNAFKFKVDTINALCIASDGEIGIGIDNPQYKLHVGGNIRTTGDLYVDNNFGVGTDNPSLPLDVRGDIIAYTSSTKSVRLVDDGNIEITNNNGGIIDFKTADNEDFDCRIRQMSNGLQFMTGGNGSTDERLRITSTGVVGIGTTNPTGAQKLNVYADSNGTGGIIQITQQGTGDAVIDFQLKGTREYSLGIDNDDSDKFKLSGSAGLDNNTLLTVTNDGKLGLGVNASNPTYQLQIHESDNTAYAANATIAQLAVGNVNSSSATNSAGIHLFTDGNGRGVVNLSALNNSTSSSADFVIQTRHSATLAERLRITSDGNVGIGTDDPDHNLHVLNGSGDAVITIESTGNGNHSALEFFRTSSGGDSKGAGSIYVTGDTSESAAKMKFGVAHNIGHGVFPKMTIDGQTGKVGIGTENPVRALHVEHSDCRIRLTDVGHATDVELINASGNAVLTTNGASNLRLQTNNEERLVITSAGNIGIGTDDPQVQLNVVNPTSLGGTANNRQDILRLEGNVANDGMLEFANVRLSNGSDWETSAFRIQRRIDSTRMAYIDFGTGAGAGAGGAGRDIQFGSGDGTLMLHLDSTGKVGIGSANPTQALDVNGKIKVFGSDGTTYGLVISPDSSGGTAEHLIAKMNGDLRLQAGSGTYQASNANILLKNSTDHIIINAGNSGNVAIGVNNPQHKLHVNGDINFENGMLISNAEVGNANNIDHIWHSDASNYGTPGTWNFVSDQSAKATGNSAIQIGYLKSSGGGHLLGDVGIGTTNPTEKLDVVGHIKLDSGPVLGNASSGNTLKITGDGGYVEVGSKNSSYSHFYTDRDKYYFNKRIIVDEGTIGSYNEDLRLMTDVNDERLRIKNDTGNVGIGTHDPNSLLHLHQSSTSGFDGLRLTNSTTGVSATSGFTIGLNDFEEGRIWHYGNESIQFGVDNELHGTLRQDGRWCLGPNQTSGSHVLNVFEATGPSAQFHSNSDAGISIKDDSDSSDVEITNNNGQLTIDLDHSGQVTTEAFIIKKNGGSGTEVEFFHIDSDGNVGLGTNNPTYVLHTFNDGAVGSAENSRKYNGRFTTYTPNRLNLDIYDRRWQDTQTHGWVGTEKRIEFNVDNNASKRMWMSFFNANSTTASNVIRFGEQEDTEWMRIFDGKVGIGHTNPDELLHIFSGASNSKIVLESDNNSALNGMFWVDEGDNTQSEFYYSHPDNKQFLKVNGNGFEIYSKQTNSIIAKIGHGLGYNDVIIPNGNVGIGSEKPQTQLDVVGDDGLMVRTASNGGASGTGGAVIKMTDQTPGDGQAGFIKYRHVDSQSPGDNYGSTFFVTSETSSNAFVIGDFEHENTGFNNDLLVKTNVGIGTHIISRGPLQIHKRSTDDVQIHMTNNETGVGSGNGFTIFGGAGTNGRDMGLVNRESNGAIEFYTNNNGTLTQRGGWVSSNTVATFAINTGTTGNHSNIVISNHDLTDYNGVADRTEYPMLSDIHFTGSDNPTANRTHAAWRNDVENSITSGSNVGGNRIQIYGIHSTVNSTKYSYILYGGYLFCNSSANNANYTQTLIGSYGYAQGYINSSSSVQSANIYGGHFIGYRGGNTNGGHCYGALGRAQQTTNGDIFKTGDMTGVLGEVEVDEGQISNGYSFRAVIDVDNNTSDGVSAASTITTGYLYYGSYSVADGTTVTNKRGIWLTNSTDNYLGGDLDVSGNVTANGSKPFRIAHPLVGLSTTKDLVHTAIEGPQVDLIYRGKTTLVGGISTVNLDTKSGMTEGTFVALNRDIQCFTTNETGWTNVKGSVTGNQLTIIAQENTCTDTISWMVIGERQDDAIKASTLTDADGRLILEPDQKSVEEPVKYECEDNIHNADPNHNPKDD